jgi:sugar lactone lactonase YvrE
MQPAIFYASDVQNNVIVEIKTDGTASVFAGSGAKSSVDGKGVAASFANPVGLAIDASGNLFVVDEYSNEIRKITPDGTVTTIAGNGSKGAQDGKGSAATFNDPTGVVVDASGNLYIGDFNNATIRKITPNGTVTTIAGNGKNGLVDGVGTASQFLAPQDLVIDSSGNIYVADGLAVRKIVFQ